MDTHYSSNRRLTSRFKLQIQGIIKIIDKNTIIEKTIEIVNISKDGIQIKYQDNDFLFQYFDCYNNNAKLEISFELLEEKYNFNIFIRWIRIIDNGEKYFYIISGLGFINDISKENKEHLMDLIVSLYMENIYLGDVS